MSRDCPRCGEPLENSTTCHRPGVLPKAGLFQAIASLPSFDQTYHRVRCAMDGCLASRNFPTMTAPSVWLCSQHRGFESCGVLVIAPGNVFATGGEEVTLVDGVQYVIKAVLHAMSKKVVVRFSGRFCLAKSTASALRFEDEYGSQYIEVPESSIRELIAI